MNNLEQFTDKLNEVLTR